MPKLTLIASFYWLCLAQKVVSRDLYHKVGGEIVLKPDESTVPGKITIIVWKHGKNKVAEWDEGFGMEIYAAFKERTTLDQTTGELRITGLKKTDSGVYSFEFNGKLLNKTYKLSVIKTVPKPTITSSCNPDKTSCTLTCEGDTTDAEPVTYSWKVGEGLWEVGDKQLIVYSSNTGDSNSGYKYICKLKNSVGEGEVSEPVGDLFDPEEVPKPTITSSCNTNKTSCTLTCEGDTTDAEPVTYSWKVGEGLWEVIGKNLIVSKSDTGKSTNGYKYICKLKNSVSSEISEPVGDLFDAEPSEVSGVGGGVGVVVVILVLVAIVIAGIWVWKIKKENPNANMREILSKVFCGKCGSDGNNQTTVIASDGNNQTTAKVSDGVQPEQGVTIPLTAINAGNGQGNGAAEGSRSNSPKDESKPEMPVERQPLNNPVF